MGGIRKRKSEGMMDTGPEVRAQGAAQPAGVAQSEPAAAGAWRPPKGLQPEGLGFRGQLL